MSKMTVQQPKYEMIPEGDKFRIRALKDFGNVKTGDLGGLIDGEENLSQSDNCWITEQASVSEKARVQGNALVTGTAVVEGNAIITEHATVTGDVYVHDQAKICGNAEVTGDLGDWPEGIYPTCEICDGALIDGDAKVTNAYVSEKAHIGEQASITGDLETRKPARIGEQATIMGNAKVAGNVYIHGDAMLDGNFVLSGNDLELDKNPSAAAFEKAVAELNDNGQQL